MIQEIIVYIIGTGVAGYVLWRIFGRKRKKKNSCAGCTACLENGVCPHEKKHQP